MSWATSSLADRKESKELYNMKDILYRSRNKEVKLGKKVGWLLQGYLPGGNGMGPSGRLSN